MAAVIAQEVLRTQVAVEEKPSPAGETSDDEEMLDLRFQGLWARMQMETVFECGD